MIRYLVRRLAHTLFVLLGVSILTFALIRLAPGDYFEQLRMNPQIAAATVASLRGASGPHRALPAAYGHWLGAVLHGDLGYSLAYNSPVWPLLRVRAANTLFLAFMALGCAWLLAIPIGVWSAAACGGWADRSCSAGATLLLSVPDVLVALGLLAFALRTGWFPTGGMHSVGSPDATVAGKLKDLVLHVTLPVLALVAGLLPMLVRHVRSALLEVWDSPYIRAARGHGIPRRRLLFHHALPAAANPLISLFGVSVGTLLSGSLLVEVIMSWPGLGPFFLEAILQRDLYVVIGGVLLSTVFLVAGNLLADVLLHLADPRIRVG